ncbi:MAG: TlyA family RNA methyltransferase [Actinomycetota bacterium]
MATRRRLDAELLHRGLVPSRSAARSEIEAGRVLVDGAVVTKAAKPIAPGSTVDLVGDRLRYVSRAGGKLDHALDRFALDVAGLTALDVGSSTGGFTDCLLQRGAARVVAVDVGTEQLHARLRDDPRVDVREQTDIRHLAPASVPAPFGIIVTDVSFISLRLVLPVLVPLAAGAPVVTLVKPQFEAGRADVARGGGIIDDPVIWRRVLGEVRAEAATVGLPLRGVTPSPMRGSKGNVEFAAWWQADGNSLNPVEGLPAELGDRHLDEVVTAAETSST